MAAGEPTLFAPPSPELDAPPGLFAEIVFNRPLAQPLTYHVPDELLRTIRVGQRVKVPLRGSPAAVGYCVALTKTAPEFATRPIRQLIDEQPLLTPELLTLTKWMADYYLCGWGQVLEAAVPAGAKAASGTKAKPFIVAIPEADLPPVPAKLSRKQEEALSQLRYEDRPIEATKLAERAGCSVAVLWTLVRHGYAKRLVRRVESHDAEYRADTSRELEAPLTLNAEQAAVMARVRAALTAGGFKPFLLFGVTGSGKTEIYLQAIADVVRQGKQAIVLVPEISLTPQTIRRFESRFHSVAVLHSHLTAAERGSQWRRIASGGAQVIVGARSAIFAPTPALGLIVVDEEQESSFKQENTPRYHARDVAVRRAHLAGVPVLLGSATPSLESWQNAQKGQYELLKLPHRVGDRPMPRVDLVDLRHEDPSRGRYRAIGPTLQRQMHQTLAADGQIILFLNRRGFDTYLYCGQCGYVAKCKFCDVALTHHRPSRASQELSSRGSALVSGSQAICHYCGYQTKPPTECPECHQGRIRFLGLGTEKLEAELAEKFPGVACQRMDSDTMRRGGSHAKALGAFESGETKILFGTQMIAKGLDFPGVQLVGVVNADTALHLPDFRAAERTFQLLAQVAGRSGRGEKGGTVMVQTMTPEHPCINLAARHDYEAFANFELHQREQHGYPPFRRLVRVVVRSRNEAAARGFMDTLATAVQQKCPKDIRLLGPVDAPLKKLEGYHRLHFLLMGASSQRLHQLLQATVLRAEPPERVEVAVDVDPVGML